MILWKKQLNQEVLTVILKAKFVLTLYLTSVIRFYLTLKLISWILGFTPTPSFINTSDLKRDLEDLARKMRCKWYFKNDVTENFSQPPAFQIKSNWNPPKGQPALEMFLSQIERDIFSVLPGNTYPGVVLQPN